MASPGRTACFWGREEGGKGRGVWGGVNDEGQEEDEGGGRMSQHVAGPGSMLLVCHGMGGAAPGQCRGRWAAWAPEVAAVRVRMDRRETPQTPAATHPQAAAAAATP